MGWAPDRSGCCVSAITPQATISAEVVLSSGRFGGVGIGVPSTGVVEAKFQFVYLSDRDLLIGEGGILAILQTLLHDRDGFFAGGHGNKELARQYEGATLRKNFGPPGAPNGFSQKMSIRQQ
jgi:hypothetical protein